MKKFLLLLALLLATNIQSSQAEDKPIIVKPYNPHTGQQQGNHPRTPIAIPEVYIDEYTLIFDASCIGCSIDILDENETVVYTAIVDENGTVELPTTLAGTYELLFTRGSITFIGEFEL